MKTAIMVKPKIFLSKEMSIGGSMIANPLTGEIIYKIFHGACLRCVVQRDIGIWYCADCEYFNFGSWNMEITDSMKRIGIGIKECREFMSINNKRINEDGFHLGQFINKQKQLLMCKNPTCGIRDL